MPYIIPNVQFRHIHRGRAGVLLPLPNMLDEGYYSQKVKKGHLGGGSGYNIPDGRSLRVYIL